jgi:leucyl-tRNA synthetase
VSHPLCKIDTETPHLLRKLPVFVAPYVLSDYGEGALLVGSASITTGIESCFTFSLKNIMSLVSWPGTPMTYVLSDYGEGAVMGVPGHDTRDMMFFKENVKHDSIHKEPQRQEASSAGGEFLYRFCIMDETPQCRTAGI